MNFWELLRHPRLSRLLGVRWSGQATDGLFQSALASFVLFSPERQADALSAAVAFAVVLLPYSIVGPFVGTILDRVSRQRALLFSNLARAINLLVIAWLVFAGQTGIELTIFVLIAFGINRLILAGLSAGLPLMIETKSLISANALAVTGGSVLVVLGGGLGVAIRNLFDYLAVADHADAIMVLFAAGGYLTAALLSLRVGRKEIGPLPHEVKEASFKEGIIEMREGFAFLRGHSDAIRGILATAVQRGGITALTLTALLLERNTFNSPTDPEAGLKGFGIVLTIAGIGITLGALTAPYGVARFGRHRWIKWSLLAGAAGPLFLVFSQTPIALALTGFSVALCGQNVKVTNDALVQSKIDDYYRGRVFAVYDVLVNGAIVSGGLIAALLLPTSGVTPWVPALVSAIYLLVALRLLRPEKFFLKV
ncbi:MAG: MFS transporter [Actinobacteria bacterium]|nr:MFS transporter [Actinomycetota bacterium]MSX19732.1 MFS transporter [Actinomycetota bacterium]MSX70676.1 MFS transporter [Actinomycetota bacterium]MSY93427.1 MFS transporter [Actinomycetota bacterium]